MDRMNIERTTRKIYWLFFLLLCSLPAEAQNLLVSSPFTESKVRNEAVTRPRVDFNHDTCALVIVTLDFEDVDFEGDIKLIQLRDDEWWIYLSPGANWLTVLSEKHLPLRIEFAPVRPATTYTLGLKAPVVLKNLTVVSALSEEITMLDASRFRRNDDRGRGCALLRIGLLLPEAEFVGAVASEYRRGEWWVWMPADVRMLTIRAEGYTPLTLTFEPLKSLITYVMTISQSDAQVVYMEPEKPRSKAVENQLEAGKVVAQVPEPKPEPRPEPAVVAPQEYAVTGIVLDKKGKNPLPDAVVTLRQDDSVAVTGLTNAAGQYAFTVPEGLYSLAVSHSEYEGYVSKKPFAVKRATTVDPVRLTAVEKVPEPVVKRPKTESGWSWAAALESTVVPGLGQGLKGHWGKGIATFVGEAAMAGGVVGTYFLAQDQLDVLRNSNISLDEFNTAKSSYDAYRIMNIGLIGLTAALHVYNIIRAGTMKPSKQVSVAVTPSVLPAMGTVSPALNMTFSF